MKRTRKLLYNLEECSFIFSKTEEELKDMVCRGELPFILIKGEPHFFHSEIDQILNPQPANPKIKEEILRDFEELAMEENIEKHHYEEGELAPAFEKALQAKK